MKCRIIKKEKEDIYEVHVERLHWSGAFTYYIWKPVKLFFLFEDAFEFCKQIEKGVRDEYGHYKGKILYETKDE